MSSEFWKASTRDKVKNGTVLGMLFGASIIWGSGLYDWISKTIPLDWQTFAGDLSVPIIIIGVGAIVGYWVDKY